MKTNVSSDRAAAESPGAAGGERADAMLARFGAWCLEYMYDPCPGDIDGGSAQDEAERLGILVKVEVTEPCSEECYCAEYGDFPQDCLRYAAEIRTALRAERDSI